MEQRLHNSDDPEEIILDVLKAAASFYDGDWAGILDANLTMKIWSIRDDNSSLILVLPYATAEYRNNEQSFHEYYDGIEICSESAESHFKSAHQIRNRSLVSRSELVVFCVDHNSGGAYQTQQYAKKVNANIINVPKVSL